MFVSVTNSRVSPLQYENDPELEVNDTVGIGLTLTITESAPTHPALETTSKRYVPAVDTIILD